MWRKFLFLASCTLLKHLVRAVNTCTAESKVVGASHYALPGGPIAELDPAMQLHRSSSHHEQHSGEETGQESPVLALVVYPEQIDEGSPVNHPSEGQAVAVEISGVGTASGIVKFGGFKTPEDFADHWGEQERLFQSLTRPRSPEQKRELGDNYYKFTAAGKLLKELGRRAFLKKYGKGSVAQMRKDAAAEIKQRRAAKGKPGKGKEVPSIVKFKRFKTPKEFAERREEQEHLFQSLPRPFSPKQRAELSNNYHVFAAAGELLKEFGRKVFLKRYGKGSINQMRMDTKAEIKRRKTVEKDRVPANKMNAGDEALGLVKFGRFKTPKDFADHWERHERLFKGLARPLSLEQASELSANYYSFTKAGALLKEFGKKVFLNKYGKSSVTRMRNDVTAEFKRRKATKADRVADAENDSPGTATSASSKDSAKHQLKQKHTRLPRSRARTEKVIRKEDKQSKEEPTMASNRPRTRSACRSAKLGSRTCGGELNV